jgi:hypothetical protein
VATGSHGEAEPVPADPHAGMQDYRSPISACVTLAPGPT